MLARRFAAGSAPRRTPIGGAAHPQYVRRILARQRQIRVLEGPDGRFGRRQGTVRALLLGALLLTSCAGERPRPPREGGLQAARSRPSIRSAPPPVRGGVDRTDAGVADGGAVEGGGATGLITDEECLARGGTIETELTYEHLRRREPRAPMQPFRICRIPSPRNGDDCRDDADCAGGRCFCTGDLGGPNVASRRPELLTRDGQAAVGRCSDARLQSGSWFCLVDEGRVVIHGIIID